ncbi:YtnP family quorum-quenching lactonase [Sediminibacillus halophilus]|uniref:Glyoxylase, beta-lactamase superfamily II n=1 Tax=Sediminibacillus halophilus TaxID=482461 RepID=A0A1G9Y2X1_9BACI|nr:MBL fold metallo-hydrolase [Sediminibacillus halophilus]SDN03452.1 Glyoxylase, beta-lactamase superfamily II [Sediminibacillus halophilus]
MESLTIGRAKLTWLNGGVNHLDGGAMFGVVPKALWSKKYPCNEKNQIELRTDPILLELDGKRYLVDSGIGYGKLTEKQIRNFGVAEQSSVESSLQELGLSVADIDAVLMTHLHFDHACGLTKWQDNMLTAVFPDTPIYVNQTEWEEMRNPNIRSVNTYWPDNWQPIENQFVSFEEQLSIAPGLEMIHTGGHSNGHSILLFKDGIDMFIHMADLMPTHAHQNKLWALAYDDYPVTSVHEKQKWMEYGLEHNAWYTFYHDAYYRALKFDKDGNPQGQVERARYPYTENGTSL